MQVVIDRVSKYLAKFGVRLGYSLNPTADQAAIEAAQERMGLPLPSSYIEFVTQFANGLSLSWSTDDGVCAAFNMEDVETSVNGALSMRDWRFYSEEAARKYGFPYVDDSNLALVTNRLMHNWIPLHAEGNGDNLSLNLNRDGFGNVVFDDHSWLDGGTGANGDLMATDLPTFFQQWGEVCFCQPKSLWWKSVLTDAGVNWESEQFDDRFRLNT
jgi:cell wall assembly regulator SMI1